VYIGTNSRKTGGFFIILPNNGGFVYFPHKCGGFLELTLKIIDQTYLIKFIYNHICGLKEKKNATFSANAKIHHYCVDLFQSARIVHFSWLNTISDIKPHF
jgi:hypothetical protein